MKKKHVPFLFIYLLMFSFVVVKVESAEPPIVAQAQDGNLDWEVRAPLEVKIGEEFSVIFNFKPVMTLDVNYVNVTVYGVIGPGGVWDEWKDSWGEMRWYNGTTYTKTAYFTAVKEGGVYGKILYSYEDMWGEHHLFLGSFGVTQIHVKSFEELESDYNSLNQSYVALQKNYDSLKSDLNNTTMLMYVSMIITAVFVATTIYFGTRKTKVKQS